jgi:hypothetical protein
MIKEELRAEIVEITKVFQSAKYYSIDFKYVNSVKFKMPIVYKTYCFFIERIFHSICVSLILDLCILFDKKEKFSFEKLCNKMREGYSTSELNNYQTKSDFDAVCKAINHDRVNFLLHKLKTTRDEYYAHLDRNRTAFKSIRLNSSEIDELISIAETFIKTIELKYFDSHDISFELPNGELGHTIFERLNEWENYRGKYGLLKMK